MFKGDRVKRIIIRGALLRKMDEAFKGSTRRMIARNEGGLTRTELRSLERHGWLEKLSSAGTRKYHDTTPTMGYVYKMTRRPTAVEMAIV